MDASLLKPAVVAALLGAFGPLTAMSTSALPSSCEVRSTERQTPVIELYTSEGCSSCPPADRWISTLKNQGAVVQAFHVGYWDYIGWVDRFANPAFTDRQRDIAASNRLRTIYTPQLVRDGMDWRQWGGVQPIQATAPAGANISLQRLKKPTEPAAASAGAANEQFVAVITPAARVRQWTAYWTITEHGHSSRVQAGENRGETLKHDFVVRQYTPVGRYEGAQRLVFAAPPPQASHPRQINLVVTDAVTQVPLQAVSLACPLDS